VGKQHSRLQNSRFFLQGQRTGVKIPLVTLYPAVQPGGIAAFGQVERADSLNQRLGRGHRAYSVPLQAVQRLERGRPVTLSPPHGSARRMASR